MAKISDETRAAILEAAWDLMAAQRRLDVGMAEIAAAAGVTRQTLFLAFGNRAGVLVAMARHQDSRGDHVQRMRQIAGAGVDRAALHAFIDAWLDYLPIVYPVAIQLETASLSDPDANAAWQDRIFSQGVRVGLDRILGQIVARGGTGAGGDPGRLADLCLTWLVPSAWRYLVIERGWTPDAFARSRHRLVDALLDSVPDAGRDAADGLAGGAAGAAPAVKARPAAPRRGPRP